MWGGTPAGEGCGAGRSRRDGDPKGSRHDLFHIKHEGPQVEEKLTGKISIRKSYAYICLRDIPKRAWGLSSHRALLDIKVGGKRGLGPGACERRATKPLIYRVASKGQRKARGRV